MNNLLSYTLLLASFFFVIQSKKPFSRYVVIYHDLNCTFNSKYVRYLSCDIEQPEKQHISSYLIYTMDMLQGYKVNVSIDVPRTNGEIMNILNLEVDICEFFDRESNNNAIKIIRQSFDDHGNYTGCPQHKDVSLGLFNWTIDVSKLPYAPETDFIANLIYFLPKNIETLRFRLYGRFQLRRQRPLYVLS